MWPAKGDPGFRGVGNAPMPQQWALNPAAYQNMSNEQVDWARLAQQWIMMKDSIPMAPPPPHLSIPQPAPPGSTVLEEEGGEAPMDISKDEDLSHPGGDSQPWNNGNNWQQPWNRQGYWSKNEGRFPPSGHDLNRGKSTGYNSHGFDGMPGGPGQHQMAPFIRPRHQWEGKNMKIDRRFQNAAQNAPTVVPEEEPAPVIDAAKRRTLPSWIREGLEKMEREKQKREEKEKVEQEREEAKRQRLKEEQQALLELEAEKTGIPVKSKFESDSEEDDGEEEEEEEELKPVTLPEQTPRPRRRFHDGPVEPETKSPWAEKPMLSYAELMLSVRRTMTELLAEVTNSEIETLGEEALRKALTKASAKRQPAKNNVALAPSKTSLGLAIYGSESEGSSSESDTEDPRNSSKSRTNLRQDSDNDSDEDIKETIRKKQQEFVVKEREIAAIVAEAKEREQKAALNSVKSGAESVESVKDSTDIGQPQRQVESIKEHSNADEGKNGKSAKIDKTERKQRSRSRSSSASSSSSHSSHSSRQKKRKKEKRDQVRVRDRKKDRKRRRSSSGSRRSKSPRHRSKSPKRRNSPRDRKRRGSRDRSRTRRRRSRSSDSYRKTRRRSRSRSDSSRRRRRRRSTSSSSSSSDRRSRKRR
ncbi:arginine/serine-rich protein PNISR-like isoform X3 [Cloeon dipterum]|uniref:arginine/serine-rich protein PNISR-like isoform X3 n=1 Tax=Cloeon dipterum TaxID=197152 RepID=UPI00321F80F5